MSNKHVGALLAQLMPTPVESRPIDRGEQVRLARFTEKLVKHIRQIHYNHNSTACQGQGCGCINKAYADLREHGL